MENTQNKEYTMIVTPERLSNHYVKKYKLSEEQKVTLAGWKLDGKKLKEDEEESVELYSYRSDAKVKKREKLEKGTEVELNKEPVFYFRPKKKCLLLLIILFLLLLLFMKTCQGGTIEEKIPNPIKNVIGDEKFEQESTQEEDEGIVYAGFPSDFTINKDVRYLSVQNSEENKDKFYTAVKLLEGDKVIYDIGEDVISPGKYVNIDLYSLLDEGVHEITICQGGYVMDDNFTQVATSTSQVVHVTVK